MKIRNKLFLLGIFILVVFAASTAVMVFFLNKVKIGSRLYTEVRVYESFLSRAALLKSDMNQVRAALLTVLQEEDAGERKRLIEEISNLTVSIETKFDELFSKSSDTDIGQRLSGARQSWQAFRETRDKEIIPAVLSGDTARGFRLAMGIQKQRYESFISFLAEAVDMTRNRIDGIERDVALLVQKNVNAFVFRGVIFLVSVFVLVLLIGRSVTYSIRRLVEAAKKVAGGDLTTRAEVSSRDEIGDLADSFNKMTRDIARFVDDERKLVAASATLAAERVKSDELEKAYFELTRTQQKYKDLVDNLSAGVYRCSAGPGGKFFEVNPAMIAMFEASSVSDLLGRGLNDFFVDRNKGEMFNERLSSEGLVKGEEVEFATIKGRSFWVSLTTAIKKDEKGHIFSYGIIQDISEHKRMEFRLLEERERLSKIAASMGAGLSLIDRNLKIVWVNEAMEAWFGRSECLEGQSCYTTYQFRDAVCEHCPLQKVFETGQSLTSEKRVTFPDGRVMDFLFVCSPFKNEKGDVEQVLELVLDITERKRIVELLEYERALSRNVIDSINDALIVVDSRSKAILDVNRPFTDFYHISKEAVVGKRCDDITVALCFCDERRFDEVVRTGRIVSLSHAFDQPDGRTIFLDLTLAPLRDEKSRIIGIIILSRDITDRKRLEEELKRYSESLEALVKERTKALQKSELMFRKLFESAHDGILIIDYETGRIIDVNPSLLSIFECVRGDCIGMDCRALSCFSNPKFFEQVHAELQHKIFASYDALPMKTFSGKDIFVEVRASLYFVEDKKIFECHIRDVTERIKMEKIKSEFVSMVSHELRTPLSAIKEGVEIVADGTQGRLNQAQHECLGIALSNINRLNRLIGDILDISKIQSKLLRINAVMLSVSDVIDQVYALARIEIENRGMVLVTDIEKNTPPIVADRDRLIQVLMNLLNNAVKFTREKSRITISCRPSGDFAEFAVRDEGAGIPQGELSRLFEKFVQLDSTLVRRVGGTGLGLYISRNLVEAMGGRIWAESKLGEGSTFRFTIPVKKGNA